MAGQQEVHKTPLRKSASFSSSATPSQSSPGSSSLGSATSTMSLRSSTPLRTASSTRALRSDTINTFQKWETTVESISYVSTKTVSISDFNQEPQLQNGQTRQQNGHQQQQAGNGQKLAKLRSLNGLWLLICLLNNGALTPIHEHVHDVHLSVCVCACVFHELMHHKHFHLNNFHQRSGKLLALEMGCACAGGCAGVCIGVDRI